MMLGGLPLPGGVTYVRTDLLKNKYWESLVSLAGPASNFLLYIVLSLLLHPRLGWVDPYASVADWTFPQQFVGCLAFLQLFSVVLNMIPIPPLDGFGTLKPFLPASVHDQIMTYPIPMICSFGFFFLIIATSLSFRLMILAAKINFALGFSPDIPQAFIELLYNR
jgi:Zn-dependent protease